MNIQEWEGIHDVWASNLEDAFIVIREMVKSYPYIAFDTEFPGKVAVPMGRFNSRLEFNYQTTKLNVDLLKVIQVGLTFFDKNGTAKATWQFNFVFDVRKDMFAQEAYDLLRSSLNFDVHAADGIDPFEFGALLVTSGVVLSDEVKWICFHGAFDFGYLINILTGESLPEDYAEFYELLKIYFPAVYDLKHLIKGSKVLKGGLQEISEQLNLQRIGQQHTAGSDSLLTGAAFFKIQENNILTLTCLEHVGQLFGPDDGRTFSVKGLESDQNGRPKYNITFEDVGNDRHHVVVPTML